MPDALVKRQIAEAACEAYAERVENPEDLPEALKRRVEEVKKGRSAAIAVRLANISE